MDLLDFEVRKSKVRVMTRPDMVKLTLFIMCLSGEGILVNG